MTLAAVSFVGMWEVTHSVTQRPARFGDFEMRHENNSLLRLGRKVKLQPQPYRVLEYLLAKAPAIVTREELGEHIWGAGVHVDLDQSVNFCIRQIRQVLGDSATEPRYVETLPRQGYRFIGKLEEKTPDAAGVPGGYGETERGLEQSNGSGERRGSLEGGWGLTRWAWLLVAALVLAIGGMAFRDHLFQRGVAHAGVRSIAVLPLDNLSRDAGQSYMADGVTDELTTMLAKNSTLRVISRTSVMQYKGVHRPLRDIARELGVDGVIEGSVASSGDQVHINLQLIQAATDTHLWAESYDSKVSDAALLPEDAARAIAKRLDSATATTAERSVNPEAREAYLRGEYLWPTDQMKESRAYFLKATEIQPDYAAAWAGLADYYGEGIAGDTLEPRANMPLEEQAARRAVELDPNLAEAHQAMGAAYFIDHWDWEDADREFQRAISLDPHNSEIYYVRACLMAAMNRDAEAIELAKKSMELNQFERPWGLDSIYLEARRYDEALTDLRWRVKANLNDAGLLAMEFDLLRHKGDYPQAVEVWARWHELTGDPQSAAELKRAYQAGGVKGFVRWELQRRMEQAKTQYVSPVELASYHAELGEREATLALLDEGYRQRSTDMLWIEGDPAFDFLHTDHHYREIEQKIGQPAAK